MQVEAVVHAGGLAGLHHGVEGGDHAEGGQGDEALAVALVDGAQLAVVEGVRAGGADAEGVEGQVLLGVAVFRLGELVAQGLVDIDELVAPGPWRCRGCP